MARNFGLPRVTAEGNLTADPELRFTNSGKPFATFTIAATERTFDRQSNEWKDGDSAFLSCIVWGDQAQHAADSLTRGTNVFAAGKLRQRKYETKDGDKRTAWELIVDSIGPLLDRATASVTKVSNNGGGPAGGGWANTGSGSQPSYGNAEGGGWAAPADGQQAFSAFDDEQPF